MKIRSLLVSSLFISLASFSINPAYADKANDTLVVSFNKEIQTLDALYSTSRENIILNELTSDQLVSIDPVTKEYLPALAKSFKYLDSKSIEFTLRGDIKFHDGSAVTVDDIIYSVNWVADNEAKTKRGSFIRRWLEEARKTGPNTLVIEAKKPYPLMLRDIAMFVLTRKNQTYHTNGNANPNAQTESFIGTGPYKVMSFNSGSGVKLERFEHYYADSPKGKGQIKHMTIRSIPDWSTVIAEMMSNGVDWTYNVPDEIAENLGRTPLVDRIEGPSTRIAYLTLDAAGVSTQINGQDNPFTKLKVRQAMNHAINNKLMVDFLVKGTSRVISGPCFPGMFACSDSVTKYDYDPQKAKALLAEAGYPNGFEFDIWAYREKSITEAVAADLARIGIKANVKYVKLSAFSKARSAEEMIAYHGTWGYYGTLDIGAISNHFVSGSNRNLNKDPKVEGLFKKALETVDANERLVAYKEAQDIIADQAYWVPLYQYSVNYAASKEVDFEAPVDGLPRLYNISWK